MRRVIVYVEAPAGRRCYVMGLRLHHGTAGLAGAIVSLAVYRRHRRLGLAGLAAGLAGLAGDWRDFPFRDTDNH